MRSFLCTGDTGPIHVCPGPFSLFALEGAGHETNTMRVPSIASELLTNMEVKSDFAMEGHLYFQATSIAILFLFMMTFLTVFCLCFRFRRRYRANQVLQLQKGEECVPHGSEDRIQIESQLVTLKPGRPRAVRVTFDSIQLEWTKPEQGHAHNVTSYTICYRSTADSPYEWSEQDAALCTVTADDQTHERVLVTQLVEKTTYHIKVRPECTAGHGLESDISEPIKTKAMIPSQPGKPQCSSVSHNNIQLEWTKPEQGAHNVIAYRVFYCSHNDPSNKWTEQKVENAEEAVTVSNLLERTVYSFKVQPECEDGFGLESNISEAITTKMIMPSKPGKPIATKVTHDSIELEWTKPEQGAHNVTSYTICYRSTAGPPYEWSEQDATLIVTADDQTRDRVLVMQLVEKTTYHIKVQPECTDGHGLESDISEPIKTKGMIPSQPGKPMCSSVSHNSVQLEWTKPEQGAHNIITYRVFYCFHNDPSDEWIEKIVENAEETVTVSELFERTVYSFKVQPECEDGFGLESDISEAITTKMIIPSKPGKPIATMVTHDSIQLKWTRPEQGAHNVNSYTVFFRTTIDPPHVWKKQKTIAAEESVTLFQLLEENTYFFKIRPECGEYDVFGSESEVSEAIMTKMIVPSKPGKPEALYVTHNSIQLKWAKPEHGAHNIISYTVFYRSVSNPPGKWMQQTTNTAEERATVSQLSENNTYFFKVRPGLRCGESGVESIESDPIKTKMIIPSKPGKPKASNITHDSVQLEWTTPEQGAHNITSYTIFYHSIKDPANQWKEMKVETVSNRITVPQLSEKTVHFFKVRSMSEDGDGIESDVSGPVRTTESLTFNNVFGKLWEAREKWYYIGVKVGLKTTDLDGIRHDHDDKLEPCLREMIKLWLKQIGATWGELINALRYKTVGFYDLANSVASDCFLESNKDEYQYIGDQNTLSDGKGFTCPQCGNCSIDRYLKQECPKFSSSSDLAFPYLCTKELTEDEKVTVHAHLLKQTHNIITEFSKLLRHVRKSLQKVDPEELALSVRDIAPRQSLTRPLLSDSMKKVNSVNEVIGDLQGNNYISFFNYHIIQDFVEQYGTDEDKTMFRMYETKFSRFCKRSVFEIPKAVFGPPPKNGELLAFKVTKELTENLPREQSLRLQDNVSPNLPSVKESSKALDLSLEDTLTIQSNVAEALGLKNVGRLVFLGVQRGCIELRFSAPKSAMDTVKTQLNTTSCGGFANLEDEGIHILCGPPGKPYPTNINYNSVNLEWSRPEYQGFHPLHHYVIRYRLDTDPQESWRAVNSKEYKESAKIFSLPRTNVAFIFKVQAVNEIGSGIESEESDPIYLLKTDTQEQTLFSQPGKPTFSNITYDTIELQWTEPEHGSDDIVSYNIFYRSINNPPDQWMEQRTRSTEKSMLISQLSEKNTYYFKVQAEGKSGLLWLESDISEPIKTKIIIPSKPGKPQASKIHHNSIELEWTEPEQGAHNIISYAIMYRSTTYPPDQWRKQTTEATVQKMAVTQLSEKTVYYFKVVSEYENGLGPESDVSEPIQTSTIIPSKPGKPKVLNVTHDSVQLEWTKPEQGSHNITSYTVFYRSTSDPPHQWKEYTAVTNENVLLVSQLSENTIFYFKIVPECEAGIGLESEISDPIKTKAIIYSKPGKPKASNITHDSVELQWTEPEHGSDKIVSYNIFYCSINDQPDQWMEQRTRSTEKSMLISQLSEKNTYYFKVQAEGKSGLLGLESDISESIKTKMIIPSKPGKPQASKIHHNSIELEWTEPEQGAHNIISYAIMYRSTTDPPDQWRKQTAEATVQKMAVTQLSEKTVYYFKVVSEYENGLGPESDVSEPIQTSTIIPSKPGKPKALNVTHDSVQLEWTKPEQGSHNITSYTVFYRSTSDPPHQWKEYTAVTNENVLLVSQLSENTIFYFKIVPESEAGVGLESEISDPIKTKAIIYSKPGKPKALNITHDSVQLEWTKPQEGAHDITSYTILYRSADEHSNQWIIRKTEGSEERVTVTQLSEKTIYYFKVRPEYRESFGSESDVSEAIITRTVLPSKPGKPKASKITHNSIQLEWIKPEQGAHNITSYIVFYRSIGEPPDQWSEHKTEYAEERATVSLLSETTTYCFKIQSVCDGGYGIESDTSEPIRTLTSDESEYIMLRLRVHDMLLHVTCM